MANRLGVKQQTISIHLQKMPELAKLVNTELSKGFTVSQVAEKHGWAEPPVWSIALEGKSDLDRFKALNWGLRTWDLWNWNDWASYSINQRDITSRFEVVINPTRLPTGNRTLDASLTVGVWYVAWGESL